MAPIRAPLPTGTPTAPTPVSSWFLTGFSRDTLRRQVQGTWAQARLQACLPRLHRFVVLSPRRQEHQEPHVRAWLLNHTRRYLANEQEAV
jgi:hypothetical protein